MIRATSGSAFRTRSPAEATAARGMPLVHAAMMMAASNAAAMCPGIGQSSAQGGRLPANHPSVAFPSPQLYESEQTPRREFAELLKALDLHAVKEDIKALLHDSKEHWPADYGNYGPLLVRLAWHCSGSYRLSDGRGGCDGGRQRFDPERSWEDNTNLDKARALLWPIKRKYGRGLSWGDLFIFAGTTAIQSMGGPILGFCAGRIDEPSGEWSAELGPTAVQQRVAPCPVNGNCSTPLGSTTIGLIYLNPEGPMGRPIPEQSAEEVRDTFRRMNMNDTETVALIGGGHAFGKTHGACPDGAGPSPKEDPINPWPGKCGTGMGADAYTSGFEGPWTTSPTKWDNEYFKLLVEHEWEPHKGPGGRYQWRVKNGTQPTAPGPAGGRQETMMMTSDISLTKDPTGAYQKIVRAFAENAAWFDNAFAHAWYKLTTRDMGPVTRCMGPLVPPPQPWQNPLPPPLPSSKLADFIKVKQDIVSILHSSSDALQADEYDRNPYHGALLVRLAWQCASTFRVTDYLGGCNGARIRHSPQSRWPENAALDRALLLLAPIKERYGTGLSWADLIVLAGSTALEQAGAKPLPFCGGRTDALDGRGTEHLQSPVTGEFNENFEELKAAFKLKGLEPREFVALMGGHSLGQMHPAVSGYTGSWTLNTTSLSNEYYNHLFSEKWVEYTVAQTGKKMYKAAGKELYALKADLALRFDPELAAIASEFAADVHVFLNAFAAAWTNIVNADRFDGPAGNLCEHLFASDSPAVQ